MAEIIFGLFTEEGVKEQIIELVKEFYPHTQVFQAKMNNTNFDLDIVPNVN